MNVEEQLLDLQDQNEVRVAKLNDMHVKLQLLRSTLPQEDTAVAPPPVDRANRSEEASSSEQEPQPDDEQIGALEAMHRGLVAEAAQVRKRQAELVQRSVHDLEHHSKADLEALLAEEVAGTVRQFDEATKHLRELVQAENAAAARMNDVLSEHQKIEKALDNLERDGLTSPVEEAAAFKKGLRAHLSALLDTFFPKTSEAATPEQSKGSGKRAREEESDGRGAMEVLVFALLDAWPEAVDLNAPRFEGCKAEHVDLLVSCGVAERDSTTPGSLRLVNFNE